MTASGCRSAGSSLHPGNRAVACRSRPSIRPEERPDGATDARWRTGPRLAPNTRSKGNGNLMSQSFTDLPHAAELGAFVGNSGPDWSALPGIRRQPNIFEYGNIETLSRFESCSDGYRLVDRDRVHESTAAEFSHVDDVERFIAIRDGSRRSAGVWFPGRATASDAVTLQSDGGTSVFPWGNGHDHIVRAFGIPEASAAYRLAWGRALPLEQVIDVVSAGAPGCSRLDGDQGPDLG